MSNSGGKAKSLIFLRDLGLNVPEFIVLPMEDFRDFRRTGTVPPSVTEKIERAWSSWGRVPVAIRSSASCEDGETASFAGMFETHLGLTSLDTILDSIERCWRSVDSDRVASYCERRGLDPSSIEMAVIMQRMIEPGYAGVLFTLDPVKGDDSKCLLEVCEGRGENLVSGLVTPTRYRFSWSGDLAVDRGEELPALRLSDAELLELRECARKIQVARGRPQDIEFAAWNGKFHFLQARDITRVQFPRDLGEWTTADFRDGGVSSAVVSPAIWELYGKVLSTSMPEFLVKLGLIGTEEADRTEWYRVFFGRPYWNLAAVKNVQAALPGFVERNFDKDMSIPITYEGHGRVTGLTLGGLARALRALIAMRRELRAQMSASERLLEEFPAIEASVAREILSPSSALSLDQKLERVLALHERVETEYFRTIYNASNAKLEFHAALDRARRIDPDLSYIHLIADLGELRVTQSAVALRELASKWRGDEPVIGAIGALLSEGRSLSILDLPESIAPDFDEYLREFGHHSEKELDLRVPRWREDLRFCLRTFLNMVTEPERRSSEEMESEKRGTYENARERFRRAHERMGWFGPRWRASRRKLETVRRMLWLREELRDNSTRVYGWIRHVLLEISSAMCFELGLSAEEPSEKIFYLYPSEVLSWLRGGITGESLLAICEDRRAYALGYEKFRNPNEIGAKFSFARLDKTVDKSAIARSLPGIGCSTGVVRARARVVRSLDQLGQLHLQRGEILVAPFTDPGWTPVFGLASAVVTETGGLLSHAALISREYGIPSVLNVQAATEIIRDGQMIEVDGGQGVVSIL